MTGDFALSVASDLAASLISSLLEKFGAPSIGKLQEQLFWRHLIARTVRKLCMGYEELESGERAEGDLLVIDERFFQDSVVKAMFTERIVVGDVDRGQLRRRFVALYGESQVALFDRNLNDALSIFEKDLNASLAPAERAAFAELRRQLERQTNSLESLDRSTRAILTGQARNERLLAEGVDRILKSRSSGPTEVATDPALASEYEAQLDPIRFS